MRKVIVSTLLLTLGLPFIVWSQSTNRQFYDRFLGLMQTGPVEAIGALVANYEKAFPQSPEMFIARFNYYLQRNMTREGTLGRMTDGRYGMFEKLVFNPEDYEIAVKALEDGLALHPQRMDMIIGLVDAYWYNQDFNRFAQRVIKTIDSAQGVNNRWTLLFERPVGSNPAQGKAYLEDFVFNSLNKLMGWIDVAGDEYRTISDKALGTFPDSVKLLNAGSYYYSSMKQFDKAIELLTKAQELAPQDEIVSSNLARTLAMAGQVLRATSMYQELSKSRDQEIAQEALEFLRGQTAPGSSGQNR